MRLFRRVSAPRKDAKRMVISTLLVSIRVVPVLVVSDVGRGRARDLLLGPLGGGRACVP